MPVGPWPPLDLSEDSEEREWHAVVIRTDYSDGPSWRLVVETLQQPWAPGQESFCQFFDDPGWTGATADEVLAALPANPPEVVFLADAATMRGEHPLLAVCTDPSIDDEDGKDAIDGYTRNFRILPTAVGEMVANLALGTMDYLDFATSAYSESGKIHRGWV